MFNQIDLIKNILRSLPTLVTLRLDIEEKGV